MCEFKGPAEQTVIPISLDSRLESGIYLDLKNKRGLDGETLDGDSVSPRVQGTCKLKMMNLSLHDSPHSHSRSDTGLFIMNR